MDCVLNEAEVRILGCLLEKEMTTPEYYPLSLNALTNACNQKSNRNPVVAYDEAFVAAQLDNLREKGLARPTHESGSRVTKYMHEILSRYDLSRKELATLAELFLRGPQTAGELRSRAGRMAHFEDLLEMEQSLQSLMDHVPQLVEKLSREPGKKECRYRHLFAGFAGAESASACEPVEACYKEGVDEKVLKNVEQEIRLIRQELDDLKRAFDEFRSQF